MNKDLINELSLFLQWRDVEHSEESVHEMQVMRSDNNSFPK